MKLGSKNRGPDDRMGLFAGGLPHPPHPNGQQSNGWWFTSGCWAAPLTQWQCQLWPATMTNELISLGEKLLVTPRFSELQVRRSPISIEGWTYTVIHCNTSNFDMNHRIARFWLWEYFFCGCLQVELFDSWWFQRRFTLRQSNSLLWKSTVFNRKIMRQRPSIP